VIPWWEEREDRYDWEIWELQNAGGEILEIKKDSEAGVLSIKFRYRVNDVDTTFEVEYPPTYPYTRFELYAPELELKHHQNPFLKNLCVLPRRSENWDIDYTVATFLRDRVSGVITAGLLEDRASAKGLEVEQAEPFSTYLRYADDSIVLIDSNLSVPQKVESGTFALGIESLTAATLRGAVLDLHGSDGAAIFAAPDSIRRRYKSIQQFYWNRSRSIPMLSPKQLELALSEEGVIRKPHWRTWNAIQVDVAGILAPDEIGWRETGDTFICLVRIRVDRPGFRAGRFWETFLARPDRLPVADKAVRVPEIGAVAKKKIAIIGAGCLGAAAAVEFARSGVSELRIMDEDVIEAATTVRWPLGIVAAGRQKCIVLKQFLEQNFPNTSVIPLTRRYGVVPRLGGATVTELERFLSGVDAIYDATAEEGISYPLSEDARKRECIYISVHGLGGAWGGRVVRIRPNANIGCWVCYKFAVEDGTIPTPPSESRTIQPVGCAEPTFTGTNFDMQHMTLVGVRALILSLIQGDSNAPLDMPDDVFTLALRDTEGNPITPTWLSAQLVRHPKCPNH